MCEPLCQISLPHSLACMAQYSKWTVELFPLCIVIISAVIRFFVVVLFAF